MVSVPDMLLPASQKQVSIIASMHITIKLTVCRPNMQAYTKQRQCSDTLQC